MKIKTFNCLKCDEILRAVNTRQLRNGQHVAKCWNCGHHFIVNIKR